MDKQKLKCSLTIFDACLNIIKLFKVCQGVDFIDVLRVFYCFILMIIAIMDKWTS
jgi:hypothetical protein